MAKALKHMLANQLQDALEGGPGLLMIDPGNMTVDTVEAFRTDLREKAGGARMRIIHNRTAKVALRNLYGTEDQSLEDLDEVLRGPNAVVYGGDGVIPAAKVLRDWKKKHKALTLKGAFADGEYLGKDDAAGLADMPDLTQLKGMLAGAILGSARGIAASLQGVYGGLARCLQARIDEQGGADDAAEG